MARARPPWRNEGLQRPYHQIIAPPHPRASGTSAGFASSGCLRLLFVLLLVLEKEPPNDDVLGHPRGRGRRARLSRRDPRSLTPLECQRLLVQGVADAD